MFEGARRKTHTHKIIIKTTKRKKKTESEQHRNLGANKTVKNI